MINGIDFNGTL